MPTNIFYNEADGTTQGPFTEKQVLEGYRKAWFDASTVFHFTTTEDGIGEETEGHTLRALIDSNGPANPFAFTGNEAKLAERLDVIDQSITFLVERQSIHMKNLTEKLDTLERISKETIDKSAAVNLNEANKIAEKPEKVPEDAREDPSNNCQTEENENQDKVFTDAAQFVVEVYDALRSVDFSAVMGRPELPVDLIRQSDSNHRQFFTIISQLLKKKEMFVCGVCSLILINYKHALIHLIDPEHFKNMIETNKPQALLRLSHSISIAIERETKRLPEYIEWRKKGCELPAAIRRYCTRFGFAKYCTNQEHFGTWQMFGQVIQQQYETVIFGANFEKRALRDMPSLAAAYERGLQQMKRGNTADRIVHVIRNTANLSRSNENTVCQFCNMLTGSVAEFCKHQCSYAHVTAAPCSCIVTLALNVIEVRDRVQ